MSTLLKARGVQTSGFQARQLTGGMLSAAGLVLTMTLEQRAWVASTVPGAAKRTFTLLEFIDLGTQARTRANDDQTPAEPNAIVAWAGAHRGPAAATRGNLSVEIADPYGRDSAAYLAAFSQIDSAIEALTRLMDPG
jgi:protein-tyrosine phosphatase